MSVEQRDSSKLLMGIIGALVTVVILVFAYQWFSASSSQEMTEQETATVTPAQEPIKTDVTAKTEAETEAASANTLVQEDLLKAPVPENPALAKEEISRLEDIQSQLDEQKATLDAQRKDADELIKLKEEQIKLLEAQLAEKS